MADGREESTSFALMVKRKGQDDACPNTQFKCKTTRHCMFTRFVCDGKDDCGDGSDEECGDTDPCEGKFRCDNNRCVATKLTCNGIDDCGDLSDEKLICRADPCVGKFRCDNNHCVAMKVTCNGIDDCGDLSDEKLICRADPCEGKFRCDNNRCEATKQDCQLNIQKYAGGASTTPKPDNTENHFSWLKTTVYIVIASTLGVVILISSIVIVVYRIKMNRRRERRISQALTRLYQHGQMMPCGNDMDTSAPPGPEDGPNDQHPFLAAQYPRYPGYGNIIVNVNNGVQYMPGYEYSVFMDAPPPYSEISSRNNQKDENSPPPYSTICREQTESAGQGSRDDEDGAHAISESSQRNVPLAVQNCLVGGQQERGLRDRHGAESNAAAIRASNHGDGRPACEAGDGNGLRRCPVTTRVSALRLRPTESGANPGQLSQASVAMGSLQPRFPPPGPPSSFPNINISSEFLESLFASHNQQRDPSSLCQRSCTADQRSCSQSQGHGERVNALGHKLCSCHSNLRSSCSGTVSTSSGSTESQSSSVEDDTDHDDCGISVSSSQELMTSTPVTTSHSTQTPHLCRNNAADPASCKVKAITTNTSTTINAREISAEPSTSGALAASVEPADGNKDSLESISQLTANKIVAEHMTEKKFDILEGATALENNNIDKTDDSLDLNLSNLLFSNENDLKNEDKQLSH